MLLRRIVGAVAGRKIAQKMGSGTAATVVAAGVPLIAKRGLGPLSAALTAAWGAKKVLDWRRKKRLERQQAYPPTAAPTVPPAA